LARCRKDFPRPGARQNGRGKDGYDGLAQPRFLEGILSKRPGPDRKDQQHAEGSVDGFGKARLRVQRQSAIARGGRRYVARNERCFLGETDRGGKQSARVTAGSERGQAEILSFV